MSILSEIINSAVDASCDLTTVLRKCKVMAARLGSIELDNWLIWEMNGYPEDVPVPAYRVWSLEVKGNFMGPAGAAMMNSPVPTPAIPDRVRDDYLNYKCRESIATIAVGAKKSAGGLVQVSTGDLAMELRGKVFKHMFCVQAWAEYSSGHLVEVLNSVRNRVLDFALAIEREKHSDATTAMPGDAAVSASRATQIFNTIVYGGTALVTGASYGSTLIVQVEQGNFESLESVLKSIAVSTDDIASLRAVIRADPPPTAEGCFGPKLSGWIAAMVAKAADGTWKIGLGAAGSLLAQVLAKFFGI